MSKKILVTLISLIAILGTAGKVYAEDSTCVQNYGQPTVCGVETKHVPVETDWKDWDFRVVGLGLIFASCAIFYMSRKISPRPIIE